MSETCLSGCVRYTEIILLIGNNWTRETKWSLFDRNVSQNATKVKVLIFKLIYSSEWDRFVCINGGILKCHKEHIKFRFFYSIKNTTQ